MDWQLIFQPLGSDEPRTTIFESILETTTPIIDAFSYFLLERTNDETVPDIKADLIYKGGLNNKGEHLRLINEQGKIVDEIDCSSEWGIEIV